MNSKKVIVLILSYNGIDLLTEAIDSYSKNNYENFRIIVIDNGSTDGTKEWVRKNFPEVTVLRTEINLGYSGGFNLGLRYAFYDCNADHVLITNNDVKADQNVIKSLVETAEKDETIGFVTGKVLFYDHPEIIQTVGYYEDKIKWIGGHLGGKEKDIGQFDEIAERPYSDDIFMLVKRSLYKEVGGYDTEFQFQGEQMDWQIRAKKAGYKIFYTPYAKIWHKDSYTIGKKSPFKTFYDVRNNCIVVLKHGSKEYIKKYLRWYIQNQVIVPFIKNTIKFKFNYSLAILRGALSVLIYITKNRNK
jgi:hypothetical protein